jgi:Helix-turn-helix domain
MFEIGTSLREARLRRRIDFGEAEQATKIRAKYLRALEDEQFEFLPSQTYVKGFLRTYAEYLGLDGQLYVDEYNSRFVVGEEDYRLRRSSVRPQRRRRRVEANAVLVVLALIALGTIAVIAAWTSSRNENGAPTVRSTAATPPAARAVPPLLAVHAVGGASHLAVHRGSAAGRLVYEGTLLRGQAQGFRGKRLWVAIDAPENVRLTHRGHAIKPLRGHRPRVIVVTATGIRPAS